MDFREHQDHAKANSLKIWGLYFVLLILASSLLALTTPFVLEVIHYSHLYSLGLYQDYDFISSIKLQFMEWRPILYVGLFSMAVISVTSLAGLLRSSNGHDVARSMDGRQVNHSDEAKSEKEILALNIIEEMTLAASIPVPTLYILPSESVNAFAAGKNKDTAVIAITEGALELFDRDELSGVIAHEIGHIVNNDISLNIKISSFVFGFTAIFFLARMLYYNAFYGGGRRDARSMIVMLVLAAFIALIGMLSVFAGRILQAAMSRQREYLADASSVQFTRNPEGLKSALAKLQGLSSKTKIDSPVAQEYSHAFIFSTGSIFSTHPKTKDRILRLKGLGID